MYKNTEQVKRRTKLLTKEDEVIKKLIKITKVIHDEYEQISPLFHIYRVIILSHVAVQTRSFKELKMITTLSDGNLASHLRPLDQLGMIKVIKSFENRYPKTTYEITTKGKESLAKMRKIFDEVCYHL